MSLQAFFQWPIAIKPEKIKEEKIWFLIYTVKVIYPSPNLGFFVYDRKQTEPQDPFWLIPLQTVLAAKAPRGQSHCGFEGKMKELKYRDAALKALWCKGDKEHVLLLLHLI